MVTGSDRPETIITCCDNSNKAAIRDERLRGVCRECATSVAGMRGGTEAIITSDLSCETAYSDHAYIRNGLLVKF